MTETAESLNSGLPTNSGKSGRRKVIALVVVIVFGSAGYGLARAIQAARESAQISNCNLGQIHLALANYQFTYGVLPPPTVFDQQGRPLYSWRVLLLPYMDGDAIYKEFHLDEPWDSPHNLRLVEKMPPLYRFHWSDVMQPSPGHTVLRLVTGPGTMCEGGMNWEHDCSDDPAETLLFVESGPPIPWTQPGDLVVRPGEQIVLNGVFRRGARAKAIEGGYRVLPRNLDQVTLRGLMTRNGGERIPADWSIYGK